LLQNVKSDVFSITKRDFDLNGIGIVSEILAVYSQYGGC
jgi:hypothetical protein